MELHLVADTNLFFECKSLDQLPWSELAADPIVILLTKPVLDEIEIVKVARTIGSADVADLANSLIENCG